MHPGQLHVVCRIPADVLQFLVGEGPLDPRWRAKSKHPRGNPGSGSDYAAGRDDALDADQAQVQDGAGVQDHAVPDRDARADAGPEPLVGDVDDREVLDVGLLADLDPLLLAAHHAAVPDAGAVAEDDVSRDRGGGRDEDLASQPRSASVDGVDHQAFSRWPSAGGAAPASVAGPSATFFIFAASPRFTFSSASARALTSWLSMSRLRRRPAPATSTEAESAERMRTICV